MYLCGIVVTRPAYAVLTFNALSPMAIPASERMPALSTSILATWPRANMIDTPAGIFDGRTYVHSALVDGAAKSPATRWTSVALIPTRIGPMPSAESVQSFAFALVVGGGAAGVCGGAAPATPARDVSAGGLRSMEQPAATNTETENSESVRTIGILG